MEAEHRHRELAREVEKALSKGFGVPVGERGIRVEVVDGRVTLVGRVESLAEKRRAEMYARTVPEAREVDNQLDIHVRPFCTDSEIHESLVKVLMQDRYMTETSIRATVNDGRVTLTGIAPSLVHKRLAGALAWWVPGVRDVVNEVEVVPPERDGDEQITEALMVVLDKDPLVDSEQIFVWTQGGVVKLSGAVTSEVERAAAENDAWYIWGVREVVNELLVAS